MKKNLTPEQSLEKLLSGNQQFIQKNSAASCDFSMSRRSELSAGQSPYACILCCSDSRVVPEAIFQAGFGEIFVGRTAGNTVNDDITASFEYAVSALEVPLIMVLGHSKCGAVTAALGYDKASESQYPRSLSDLLLKIQNLILSKNGDRGDISVENAIFQNSTLWANHLLDSSALISEKVMNGEVRIVSAVYDIDSAEVTLER